MWLGEKKKLKLPLFSTMKADKWKDKTDIVWLRLIIN